MLFIMIIFILRITLIICAGGWVPAQMADSAKSANEDPTVRLLRSGNYAPWQKMDACWTYVLSRLTFQLTISKFRSIKQSTEEYKVQSKILNARAAKSKIVPKVPEPNS
ncbi:hypothetical protein T01_5474 [Trichinella spiralis]|uniref:Secreted protein n=1 Tax=Trichinella spiralis TaxID=6334 RepID=A0A0V1ALW2_TRISP|nr:hypothetical protein T01_5474 [Trichinella spiralis]